MKKSVVLIPFPSLIKKFKNRSFVRSSRRPFLLIPSFTLTFYYPNGSYSDYHQ